MKKRLVLAVSFCSLVVATLASASVPDTSSQPSLSAPTVDASPGAAGGAERIPEAAGTAPTAYTIEELYRKGTTLQGKNVTVHGRVVRILGGGIMGKIWSHVQDGTGDQEHGTGEVIVVSAEKGAEVGDEVTVTGTVAVNSSKGAKVMIVNATYRKQVSTP